jgi:ribosomal protein L7Ae-like RNA K-turn-binding protein
MNNKVNLLGLCVKSGNLVSGTDLVIEHIRKNKVYLVIILNDSAENTIKKVTDKCKFYNVEYTLEFSSKDIEKIFKNNKKVFGVLDKNFAKALK